MNHRTALSIRRAPGNTLGVQVPDQHTFEVAIPAGCPASDGEIQLRYLLPGYRSERVAAVPVHVESAGGLRADDETFLLAAALPPEPPPREVAVLCIERGETADVVRMSGGAWDADGAWRRSLDRATLPAPPGALANLVNLDANAGLIVEAMRDYGSRVHELRRWLHGLVTGPHGTERVLLICDHTYARMPWEMLDVVVAGDDVPIGALLDVARWMPVPDVEGLMPLRLAEETHAGGVLSYVDVAGLRNAAVEVAALQRLSRHRSETLDAFLRRLRDRPEDLGLLYLACHGNFDSDDPGAEGVVADEISLGDLEDAQRGVSLYELRRLRRFMARRPLLFVNACYSARMTEDGVFGLPGMLLSRVAAAYIGTLGPVGSIYASRVACRFLEAAARSQGVRPARFLRELREEAAARVAPSVDEPSRLDWWEFLFAFTYVLYGNPLARVALVAGGDVAADEGEVDDAATGGASTEGGP